MRTYFSSLVILYRELIRRPPCLPALPQEPMLSGLRCLSEDIQQKLEDFLEEKLPSRTPGVRLNSKAEGKLDVIELLWTVQALKEKHFDWWWTDLTRHQKEEVRTFVLLLCFHDY